MAKTACAPLQIILCIESLKKQGENKADNPTEQLKYYKDAYAGWKYVFYHAPAWRETPFYDGMDIYRAFAENETDPAKKDAYVDTLLAFYDMRVKCWDDTKDNQFYKAFDWYTYKNTKGNEKVIYSQFDKTAKKYEADKAGINSINVAFLTPWMYTAVNATINKQINEDELFNRV
ncbi:MAG: hypothetical protein LRY27_03915 [Chitinophagales bacterium]|nr:hypothetical protein [Chitinophagales bacterium]